MSTHSEALSKASHARSMRDKCARSMREYVKGSPKYKKMQAERKKWQKKNRYWSDKARILAGGAPRRGMYTIKTDEGVEAFRTKAEADAFAKSLQKWKVTYTTPTGEVVEKTFPTEAEALSYQASLDLTKFQVPTDQVLTEVDTEAHERALEREFTATALPVEDWPKYQAQQQLLASGALTLGAGGVLEFAKPYKELSDREKGLLSTAGTLYEFPEDIEDIIRRDPILRAKQDEVISTMLQLGKLEDRGLIKVGVVDGKLTATMAKPLGSCTAAEKSDIEAAGIDIPVAYKPRGDYENFLSNIKRFGERQRELGGFLTAEEKAEMDIDYSKILGAPYGPTTFKEFVHRLGWLGSEAALGPLTILPREIGYIPPKDIKEFIKEHGIEPQYMLGAEIEGKPFYTIRYPPPERLADIAARILGTVVATYGLKKILGATKGAFHKIKELPYRTPESIASEARSIVDKIDDATYARTGKHFTREEFHKVYNHYKDVLIPGRVESGPHWEFFKDPTGDVWAPIKPGYEGLYPDDLADLTNYLKYGPPPETSEEVINRLINLRSYSAGAGYTPPLDTNILLGETIGEEARKAILDPGIAEFFRINGLDLSRASYVGTPTDIANLLIAWGIINSVSFEDLSPDARKTLQNYVASIVYPGLAPTFGLGLVPVVNPITGEVAIVNESTGVISAVIPFEDLVPIEFQEGVVDIIQGPIEVVDLITEPIEEVPIIPDIPDVPGPPEPPKPPKPEPPRKPPKPRKDIESKKRESLPIPSSTAPEPYKVKFLYYMDSERFRVQAKSFHEALSKTWRRRKNKEIPGVVDVEKVRI